MAEKDNVIRLCVCPSCRNLTLMKPMKDDIYFCRQCKDRFKQYRNGRLVYIPIAVARELAHNKIMFTFDPDLGLGNSEENEELEFDIDFEPDFDPDFDPEEPI